MKKVLLLSGKNEEVKFAVDFMRNWFCGDTKLSEVDENEVGHVYNLLFFNNKENQE